MRGKKEMLTRRSMLATGWGAVAGLAGSRSAIAAGNSTAAENRTLVCIYLFGGSDGNSLVAPLEPAQYKAWSKARGELSLMDDAFLPIRARSTGVAYGLHPALAELQRHFAGGAAAVVANVGAATRPTPVSMPGTRAVQQIQQSNGYGSLSFLKDGYSSLDWAAKKAGASATNDVAFTFDNGVSVMPVGETRFEGERRRNPALMQKIAAASFRTTFPESSLGRQLKTAAGLIRAGNITGASRQVVFIPMGGFGTSVAQMKMKAPLYRQLSTAMAAFYQATVEMGVASQVTTFTDSEFGRNLRPNGNHGADPGWGNHQFVLGGAVLGGDVYGKYPDMNAGPFDSDGALIPTTTTAQYQATLATWLGIAPSELPSLLPGLTGSARPQFLAT